MRQNTAKKKQTTTNANKAVYGVSGHLWSPENTKAAIEHFTQQQQQQHREICTN